MCKTLLICWSSLVTFFSSLKFSICVCHFGVDWLIWPVTLSKDNLEIILHVQNPVDPLIQLVTFFARLKISTCVCKFLVDLLIWSVTFFQREYWNYTIGVNHCWSVDSAGNFFTRLKIFNVCYVGVYWLIWPVTLSRENIKIILYA